MIRQLHRLSGGSTWMLRCVVVSCFLYCLPAALGAVAVQDASPSDTTAQSDVPHDDGPQSGAPAAADDETEDAAFWEAATRRLDTVNAAASDAQATVSNDQLKFAFERAPWREVINWIADATDLALQYEELPTGSFTYNDRRMYSPEDAIARINLFLLPQGFTLVRSNQLLSVINLGDPRSLQQLDAMAQLITPEELPQRPKYEVVKCMFALGEISGDVAIEELSALKLMTSPKVFSKTRQLLLIDTAEKLLQVKQVLDAFQPAMLDEGMRMASFELQHITAEDVLLVARPHLGLATGEMIGIDVSISTDLQGEHIFVTGMEDRVKLIESMVKSLDRPVATMTMSGENELRSHLVTGGNLDMVYDVLKTLLAGKSLRLSADRGTSSIVALATPDVQREIAATVAELQAADADFEVIPLRTSDPYQIITLLEQMLDLPSKYADPDEIPPDSPRIDADPLNRRLFVRAKPYKIEQIKKIVDGLDNPSATTGSPEMRMLPLQGKQAQEVLELAKKFWRDSTPVLVMPTASDDQPEVIERVPNEDSKREREIRIAADLPSLARPAPAALADVDAAHDSSAEDCAKRGCAEDSETDFELEQERDAVGERPAAFVGFEARSGEEQGAIRCQLTPSGLLLESRDAAALDRFEQHLRAIAGPMRSSASPPTVFYLQYTKVSDAVQLLAELLDGGESAKEAGAGQLVKGYVSSPGSFLGSIVTSRDGTMTMMAGTITVVTDSRLNRLIAQGTAEDIQRIEAYLKIIDKDSSITDVKTYGVSRIIELQYTDANEVAAVVREAFANRIDSGSARGNSGQRGGEPGRDGQRPSYDDRDRDRDRDSGERREGERGPGGMTAQAPRDVEPKMTVAVHERSNSLIITAPEQLIVQVEQLVGLIDQRSEQVIEVLAPENAAYIQSVLRPEDQNRRGGSSSSRNSRDSRGRDSRSRSQNSRVIDMLRGR